MKTEYNIPTSVQTQTENAEGQNVCRTFLKKICNKCLLSQSNDSFYIKSGKLDSTCKVCRLEQKKDYYIKNSDLIKQKRKNYYYNNKDKVRASESKYRKKRREIDNEFKLLCNIRNHINQFLRSGKINKTIQYLGCSVKELKNHLESNFKPGMTWENYGRNGWHIDHIFPLSKVDMTCKTEIKNALNYKNLQPLWALENLKKSNKTNLKKKRSKG